MSISPTRSRLLAALSLSIGLGLPSFLGGAIAHASPPPALLGDPAPAPAAPDPSTIINEANTILPMIGQVTQFLPFLDSGAALQDPTDGSVLQPQMLNPFVPSG